MMASSPTNVDKAHKKVISHAHTHTKQRKAWEEAPDYTPSSQQLSPEIKALRSAQTRRDCYPTDWKNCVDVLAANQKTWSKKLGILHFSFQKYQSITIRLQGDFFSLPVWEKLVHNSVQPPLGCHPMEPRLCKCSVNTHGLPYVQWIVSIVPNCWHSALLLSKSVWYKVCIPAQRFWRSPSLCHASGSC